jgi:hypothetical protein
VPCCEEFLICGVAVKGSVVGGWREERKMFINQKSIGVE